MLKEKDPKQMIWFSYDEYLLSNCIVPGTVQGAGDREVSETDQKSAPHTWHSRREGDSKN